LIGPQKGDNVKNDRKSFRIRKQFDVAWSVPEQGLEGEGLILNISLTGMLFVTDRLFDPKHGLSMGFSVEQVSSFPLKGDLVWFRRVGEGGTHYQCGVKFSKESSCSPQWVKWMEGNILKLADVEDSRILDRYLNEGQES